MVFDFQNNQTTGSFKRRIKTCCTRNRTTSAACSNVARRAELQREDNHGSTTVIIQICDAINFITFIYYLFRALRNAQAKPKQGSSVPAPLAQAEVS